MAIEIERKFLVVGDGWRAAAHRVIPMAQGYINDQAAMDSGARKASVRVRLQGEQALLNLKSRELGHTRQEFEYLLPLDDARAAGAARRARAGQPAGVDVRDRPQPLP